VAQTALASFDGDPWQRMFEQAEELGDGTARGLVPYWIFPIEGGAHVERHVPALPLSREVSHLEALRRSLAVYRMVFGQPRQDDLMAYLLENVDPELVEANRDLLQIDLSSPHAAV
jgi:hypothetical protein